MLSYKSKIKFNLSLLKIIEISWQIDVGRDTRILFYGNTAKCLDVQNYPGRPIRVITYE
jgi:hypothetical protein